MNDLSGRMFENVSYNQHELNTCLTAVKNDDVLPVTGWARVAKVLGAEVYRHGYRGTHLDPHLEAISRTVNTTDLGGPYWYACAFLFYTVLKGRLTSDEQSDVVAADLPEVR